MTLVEPTVPKGTPAMTMIRSLAPAIWWRSAMRLALATISSKLVTSRVVTAWTPQTRPRRRETLLLAVITSSGTGPRSRAIRRAVEPDEV